MDITNHTSGLFADKTNVADYQEKLNNAKKSNDNQKISELAEDFEAIFMQLMLKSMRDTVGKSGMIDGGNGEEVFRSMLDTEYAKNMAKQRFSGIAEAIERSMLEAIEGPSIGANRTVALDQYKKSNI